jgi:hypothetical protein
MVRSRWWVPTTYFEPFVAGMANAWPAGQPICSARAFYSESADMTDIRWERYPLVAKAPNARIWLTFQAQLGLAPNTIEAYGRALEDYLLFSDGHGMAVDDAKRVDI